MEKPLRYQHYKDYQLVEQCTEKPFTYKTKDGTRICVRSAVLARVDSILCYGFVTAATEISSGEMSTLFKIEDFVKEGTTLEAIYDGFYADYVIEEL